MSNKSGEKVLEDFDPQNFNIKERMDYIRSKIEHEDNLVSNRINWLLGIQGVLITMYVTNYESLEWYLQLLLILFGLIFAINIALNLGTGEKCMKRIRALFYRKPEKEVSSLFCNKKREAKKRGRERWIVKNGLKRIKECASRLNGDSQEEIDDSEKKLSSELYSFKELNDYDKRLLIGERSSKYCLVRFFSATLLLPSLCIICWLCLSILTVYKDLQPKSSGHTKIQVEMDGKCRSYSCDSCK